MTLTLFLPLLVAICSIMLLSSGALSKHDTNRPALHLYLIALLGLSLAFASLCTSLSDPLWLTDPVAIFFAKLMLLVTAVATGLALPVLRKNEIQQGSYLSLSLLLAVGVLLVTLANQGMILLIGFELLGLCSAALAGFHLDSHRSQEAGIKMFLANAMATAWLGLGLALLYGEVGRTTGVPSLAFGQVASLLTSEQCSSISYVALGLVGLGLLSKMAAVPGHLWAPDVYQGCPSALAAQLMLAAKIASGAALWHGLEILRSDPGRLAVALQLLHAVAMATLLWGNVLMLRQDNLRRMLGYSSIAHSGYLLLGLIACAKAASAQMAAWVLGFFLLGYGFAAIGSLAVHALLEDRRLARHHPSGSLIFFTGAARRAPVLTLCWLLFLLALAGLPPLPGFTGKLHIFALLAQAGWQSSVGAALLISAIGSCAYIRPLTTLWLVQPSMQAVPPANEVPWHLETAVILQSGLVGLTIGLVFLGVYPDWWLGWFL